MDFIDNTKVKKYDLSLYDKGCVFYELSKSI